MLVLHRLLETPLWVHAALVGAISLALSARHRLDRSCAAAAGVPSRGGLSGAEAAHEMLRCAGVTGVGVELAHGPMSAGYDVQARTIRLPPEIHDGRTLAAVALAAQSVGHSLQHAGGDAPQPLELREAAACVARLGSGTAALLLAVGFVLDLPGLIATAAIAWLSAALLPLCSRPTERDAARRATRVLAMSTLIDSSEQRLVEPIVEAAGGLDISAVLPRLRRPAWLRPSRSDDPPRTQDY